MSNNSDPKKNKVVPLFIAFAILFVIVFGLGVIVGKGLGGSATSKMERSYEDKVYSDQDMESEITGEEVLDDDSVRSEMQSDKSEFDEKTEILADEDEEQMETDTQDSQTDENTDTLSEETQPGELKNNSESKELVEKTESFSSPAPYKPAPTEVPEVAESKPEVDKQKNEPPEESLEESSLEDKAAPAAKSAMPKIDPEGRYTVQIGAFKVQSEANKLMNSMKSKGYPAFVQEVSSSDANPFYRVRVGTFSTRSDANIYGNRLKDSEPAIKSVFITVNN